MQKNPGCGEVGAFPGFGGSLGSGGLPRGPWAPLNPGCPSSRWQPGRGRDGRELGEEGSETSPAPRRWIWGGKGGKGGIWGRFWIGFLVCRGGDRGREFCSEVVPKRGEGGSRLGAVAGEARHGEGALMKGVISTQSPIAAPHPLGNCFKGKRGPGSVTATRVGATGATSSQVSPWRHLALPPGLAQCSSTSPRDKGGQKSHPLATSSRPGQ